MTQRRRRFLPSRRRLLRSLLVAAAGGGAMLVLRRTVIAPRPTVTFAGAARSSGWLPVVGARVATLPVRVEDQTVAGLIDTGAQLSAIDAGLVEQLGLSATPLPIAVFGLSGGPHLGRAASFDLMAGDMALEGLHAAELDLGGLGLPAEAAFSVILGQNVLRELAVELDLRRRRIALSAADGFVPPAGWISADTEAKGGRLMANIRIAGVPLQVMVDTGATAILALADDVAARSGLLRNVVSRPRASITLGGETSGREVLLPDLEFGGLHLPQAPVQIYDRSERGPLAGVLLPEGLLGFGALAGLRCTLLLGQGRLYIDPTSLDRDGAR